MAPKVLNDFRHECDKQHNRTEVRNSNSRCNREGWPSAGIPLNTKHASRLSHYDDASWLLNRKYMAHCEFLLAVGFFVCKLNR